MALPPAERSLGDGQFIGEFALAQSGFFACQDQAIAKGGSLPVGGSAHDGCHGVRVNWVYRNVGKCLHTYTQYGYVVGMSKPPCSDLTLFGSSSPPSPKLDPTWEVVCACSLGHYPWDDWERWALAQGLDPRVAGQARLLIREWFQHSWANELKTVCGWSDDGRALFRQARRAPKKALAHWEILMRTDGMRGDIHPQTHEWTWGHLQPDAKRLLTLLSR